jgi:hypothetical protein
MRLTEEVEIVPERGGKTSSWMKVDGIDFITHELNAQEEKIFTALRCLICFHHNNLSASIKKIVLHLPPN